MHLVTHYVKDVPSRDGWKKLIFFTYADKKHFHCSTKNEINTALIEEEEKKGIVKRLNIPVSIHPGQCVWLARSGDIYIGDRHNIFNDKTKYKIESTDPENPNSEKNILHALRSLWNKEPRENETLKILSKSGEWERVLENLKVQILSRNEKEIKNNSWIFDLLYSYESKRLKIFHAFCSYLDIKFNSDKAEIKIHDEIFQLEVKHSKWLAFEYMASLS